MERPRNDRWLQIVTFLLIFCLGTQIICSCSADAGKDDTQNESDAIETQAETEFSFGSLPADLNLGGQTVKILSRLFERYENELTVDSLTGDIVNDAVRNRLAAVQERLNVTVDNHKEMGMIASHGAMEIIKNSVLAGEYEYDIYVGSMYTSATASADGFWMNLYDVKYLDPSQPYWSQYYIEKASVGKKLYTITGDLAISMIRLLGVTFFNKTLVNDYGIGDLYKVVNDGTWTVEYQLGLVKDIYKDLNSNGVRDNDDLYGLGTSDTFSVDAYTSSFDLEIIAKDENNYPYINLNLEKVSSIVETVNKLCWETTGVNTYRFDMVDGEMTEIARVFSENRFVFMSNWIYSTETSYMRDMKDDYGIIPYPKFNENQKDYYSYANDQLSVFVVPKTVTDPTAAGALLEAMCAISHDTVVSAYFDVALKRQICQRQRNCQYA